MDTEGKLQKLRQIETEIDALKARIAALERERRVVLEMEGEAPKKTLKPRQVRDLILGSAA